MQVISLGDNLHEMQTMFSGMNMKTKYKKVSSICHLLICTENAKYLKGISSTKIDHEIISNY